MKKQGRCRFLAFSYLPNLFFASPKGRAIRRIRRQLSRVQSVAVAFPQSPPARSTLAPGHGRDFPIFPGEFSVSPERTLCTAREMRLAQNGEKEDHGGGGPSHATLPYHNRVH
jgi:hypothetical protein